MTNTIRSGSYIYLLQDLSLVITSYLKNGPFPNGQILHVGNLKNDLKYMRKQKLLKKVKLASSTALSGLNNTLKRNRKPKWTQ